MYELGGYVGMEMGKKSGGVEKRKKRPGGGQIGSAYFGHPYRNRNQRPPKIPPAGNVEIAHPPKNPIFYLSKLRTPQKIPFFIETLC